MAGPTDYEELMAYCAELGLRLIPLRRGQAIPAPGDGPVCYLGKISDADIQTHGAQQSVLDVMNPLLLFVRPYYSSPFLTDGQITLNEDIKSMSEQIRPTFEKLRRWVRKRWHKTDSYASYIGPEALLLLRDGGAQWRSCLHAASSETVRK